jgi:hypothetical protein
VGFQPCNPKRNSTNRDHIHSSCGLKVSNREPVTLKVWELVRLSLGAELQSQIQQLKQQQMPIQLRNYPDLELVKLYQF